jgi:NitT/TauT family transport system substrate-binding protein
MRQRTNISITQLPRHANKLVGCFIALVIAVASPQVRAADRVTVATDWSPHGMISGLLLAKQNGSFAAAGLDVDVVDGKGSTTTVQQVAAGQIDVGFGQLSSMAAAVANGIPVTSIMGLVQAGDNGLMIPADSGWKTLSDLKGKRIAVAAGAASTTFFDAFLKAGGASRSDFNIINVDTTALTSIYVSGAADAALTTVAWQKPQVDSSRPSRPIFYSDVGLLIPGYGLIVRRDALDAKSEILKRFVEVQQRTWVYIFARHEQEAIDAILAQRPGMRLDGATMLAQLKGFMPLFDTPATKGKPMGWQAETDWQNTLRIMREVGMAKETMKPSDMYTNKFISDRIGRAK